MEQTLCDELKAFMTEEWEQKVGDSDLDYYFNSYSHMSIHEEMLKDKTRTIAYSRAIMENKHAFKDKIVLDVGSGTGILSMFAAKAGASHVYAIEYSNVAHISRKIIEANNFSEKITVIKDRAEDVILPIEKVDIIISEWMGYMLLYESMLDCVLMCRDKWLKPGGLLFPDKAAMYCAALDDADYRFEKFNFWENVYGFDYRCVQPLIRQEAMVDTVPEDAIVSNSHCIAYFDLNTVQISDLDFACKFKLLATKKRYCHGLVIWFDVVFPGHVPLVFSTAPTERYTHWKQTVLYFNHILAVSLGDPITCKLAVRKAQDNPRNIDIKLLWEFEDHSNTQIFYLQ